MTDFPFEIAFRIVGIADIGIQVYRCKALAFIDCKGRKFCQNRRLVAQLYFHYNRIDGTQKTGIGGRYQQRIDAANPFDATDSEGVISDADVYRDIANDIITQHITGVDIAKDIGQGGQFNIAVGIEYHHISDGVNNIRCIVNIEDSNIGGQCVTASLAISHFDFYGNSSGGIGIGRGAFDRAIGIDRHPGPDR